MTALERVAIVDEDLLLTVRALFPGASVALGRGAGTGISFRFVPNVRRVRLLVPADAPRAAAHAVDRPSAGDTRTQVLLRGSVGTILRLSPLAKLFMPYVLHIGEMECSLIDYLRNVLGRDLRFSMAIGRRRANRKPVLNVHAVTGEEIGYAKVGLTELANGLIDHEAGTLAAFAERAPRTFAVPRPIHHGRWSGSSVLLMSTLRPSGGRQRGGEAPLDAIVELVAREGVHWLLIGDSPWFERIMTTAEELRRAGSPELHTTAMRYREVCGGRVIPHGCWHGDLGPWNMAWQGGTALIWDWERAQSQVPAALDAVHFLCHPQLRDVGNLPRARRALSGVGGDAIRRVLRGLGLEAASEDAGLIRVLVIAYLLSVATRLSADARRPDGEAAGRMAAWHLELLGDQLDEIERIGQSWN